MIDGSYPWRRLAAVVGVLAGCVVVLVAAMVAATLLYSPVSDCPPLGNGGALHVGQPVDEVPNESAAMAIVRARLADRNAATTGTTMATTTGTTGTTATLRTGGNFYGSKQIHGGISRDGSVPEHYHVDVDAGVSTMAYVVTVDGHLYRVVSGDC